jgi:hypothetical protein
MHSRAPRKEGVSGWYVEHTQPQDPFNEAGLKADALLVFPPTTRDQLSEEELHAAKHM